MSKCTLHAIAGAMGCVAMAIAASIAASDEPLENDAVVDRVFGTNGRATFAAGGLVNYGHRVVPVAGGYWVVGATAEDSLAIPRVALSRLASNGTPVMGFGTGGHRTTDVAGQPFGDAFVDSAGRLVVAVRAADRDVVVRFLANGDTDPTFACCALGNARAFDIAAAPGDGVYVSRQSQPPFVNSELIRLASTGALDPGFAPLGEMALAPRVPLLGNLHRDEQGRIWWAPFDGNAPGGTAQAVVRLTAAGALDAGYRDGGVAVLHRPCGSPFAGTRHFTVLPGGIAVVAINAPPTSSAMAALPDGSAGPLRCDDSNGSIATVADLAPRDASRFFAASCDANGCLPALRRYRVEASGAVVDDPAFDAEATTQVLDGTLAGIVVDGGKPLTVGSDRSQAQEHVLVVRYGGSNALFKHGYED